MISPNTEIEMTRLRSQLATASIQVSSANEPETLLRAVEDYVRVSLTLHDHLSRGTKTRMQNSMRRVTGLRAFTSHLNQMTESVIASRLSVSRG